MHLPKRIESAAADDENRLRMAWQLAYGRQPSPEEIAVAIEFLGAPDESAATDQLSRWEQLSHALLAGNEFMFLP